MRQVGMVSVNDLAATVVMVAEAAAKETGSCTSPAPSSLSGAPPLTWQLQYRYPMQKYHKLREGCRTSGSPLSLRKS